MRETMSGRTTRPAARASKHAVAYTKGCNEFVGAIHNAVRRNVP